MLRHRRHADAEPILREGLTILQKQEPGVARTFLAKSLLGEVLLEQKNYAESEPLLMQGYEGLKALEGQISPLYARYRIAEAGQRIVRLYQARGQAAKAAEWRTKLPAVHGHSVH
jgi:non-specific serine/threonine protein kinase/serine/threonine-protein kinase